MSTETGRETAILSIDTLVHYGLKQQPFAPDAPDAFIYSDAALDMPVSAIANYLDNHEPAVIVKGEPGVGKSTQVRRLLARLRGRFNACLHEASVATSLAELEHAMAACWHPDRSLPDEPDWLCELLTRGLRPVLVVDDAHLLSADTLEGLFLLQRRVREHCSRSFALVLFGESSLETTLSAIEADVPEAGQCHAIVLRPLTREQVAAYVDHRLRTAGLFMDNPFTGQDIEQIHQDTAGIPAAVNPAATRILEARGQAEIRREQTARQSWLRRHRVLVAVLLISLLSTATLVWLLRDLLLPPADTRVAAATPAPDSRPLAIPPPDAEPPGPRAATDMDTGRPAADAGPDTNAPETGASATTAGSTPATRSPEPVSPPPEARRPTDREERPPTSGERPGTTPETRARPPATAEPAPPAPATRPPRAARTEPAQKAASAPSAPETSPGDKRQPAPPRVRRIAGLKPPAWLLRQPPDQFGIQLLALSDPAGLARAARELRLDATLAWYHKRKGNRTLYVLVAAPYPDRAAARRAAARLPASLRRNGPWIRPLKDIQDTIYAQ